MNDFYLSFLEGQNKWRQVLLLIEKILDILSIEMAEVHNLRYVYRWHAVTRTQLYLQVFTKR